MAAAGGGWDQRDDMQQVEWAGLVISLVLPAAGDGGGAPRVPSWRRLAWRLAERSPGQFSTPAHKFTEHQGRYNLQNTKADKIMYMIMLIGGLGWRPPGSPFSQGRSLRTRTCRRGRGGCSLPSSACNWIWCCPVGESAPAESCRAPVAGPDQ